MPEVSIAGERTQSIVPPLRGVQSSSLLTPSHILGPMPPTALRRPMADLCTAEQSWQAMEPDTSQLGQGSKTMRIMRIDDAYRQAASEAWTGS